MSTAKGEVSELLEAWGNGDPDALARLMPLVYKELRQRAVAFMRRERQGHSLEPTELVHEAYLRLVGQRRMAWQNRAQFFGVAAGMMRRILVDRARARRSAKRSGRWTRVTLEQAIPARVVNVDVGDLDDALTRLASFDPRKSRVAELRFFGGLSLRETSEVLGVSVATVERDWKAARAWLYDALAERPGNEA